MIGKTQNLAHKSARRGWVLYDGACALCRSGAARSAGLLRRHGFARAPLQMPWAVARLGLPPERLLSEMKVLTPAGTVYGGVDALLYVLRCIWWAWPLYALAQIPGVKPLLKAVYRWIAERRYDLSGACTLPVRPKRPPSAARRPLWPGWLPLAIFPPAALWLRPLLPAWAFMWMLAWTIFLACKWWTWWEAWRRGARPTTRRLLGYLLAWPGMDARAFLDDRLVPARPPARAWAFAVSKTLFGIALMWGVARRVPAPLGAGWVGLVGTIFILHFGLFHLAALLWQRAGVVARPLMQAPILATSLSDFWGHRWNLGFHQLAHDGLFRPLRKRLGPAGATVAVFLASGLVHELVISLPAGAGYGGPTVYFLLQGLGLMLERSARGARRRGLSGRLFTFFITAGPVFLLFHPPFVARVAIPFLYALRAL